jgi:hypothetical protein
MKNQKSGHTPGPWSVDTRGGGLTVRATDKPNHNAWDTAHITGGNAANAALIAAAPDLLEALEALQAEAWTRRTGNVNKDYGLLIADSAARAAIAKAKGGN